MPLLVDFNNIGQNSIGVSVFAPAMSKEGQRCTQKRSSVLNAESMHKIVVVFFFHGLGVGV